MINTNNRLDSLGLSLNPTHHVSKEAFALKEAAVSRQIFQIDKESSAPTPLAAPVSLSEYYLHLDNEAVLNNLISKIETVIEKLNFEINPKRLKIIIDKLESNLKKPIDRISTDELINELWNIQEISPVEYAYFLDVKPPSDRLKLAKDQIERYDECLLKLAATKQIIKDQDHPLIKKAYHLIKFQFQHIEIDFECNFLRPLVNFGFKGVADTSLIDVMKKYSGLKINYTGIRLQYAQGFLEKSLNEFFHGTITEEELHDIIRLCQHRQNSYIYNQLDSRYGYNLHCDTEDSRIEVLNLAVKYVQEGINELDASYSTKVVKLKDGTTTFCINGGWAEHYISYEFRKEEGAYFFIIHNRGDGISDSRLHGSYHHQDVDSGKLYDRTRVVIEVPKEALLNPDFLNFLINSTTRSFKNTSEKPELIYDRIIDYLIDSCSGKIVRSEREKVVDALKEFATWFNLEDNKKIIEAIDKLLKDDRNFHSRQIHGSCGESSLTALEKDIISPTTVRKLKHFTIQGMLKELEAQFPTDKQVLLNSYKIQLQSFMIQYGGQDNPPISTAFDLQILINEWKINLPHDWLDKWHQQFTLIKGIVEPIYQQHKDKTDDKYTNLLSEYGKLLKFELAFKSPAFIKQLTLILKHSKDIDLIKNFALKRVAQLEKKLNQPSKKSKIPLSKIEITEIMREALGVPKHEFVDVVLNFMFNKHFLEPRIHDNCSQNFNLSIWQDPLAKVGFVDLKINETLKLDSFETPLVRSVYLYRIAFMVLSDKIIKSSKSLKTLKETPLIVLEERAALLRLCKHRNNMVFFHEAFNKFSNKKFSVGDEIRSKQLVTTLQRTVEALDKCISPHIISLNKDTACFAIPYGLRGALIEFRKEKDNYFIVTHDMRQPLLMGSLSAVTDVGHIGKIRTVIKVSKESLQDPKFLNDIILKSHNEGSGSKDPISKLIESNKGTIILTENEILAQKLTLLPSKYNLDEKTNSIVGKFVEELLAADKNFDFISRKQKSHLVDLSYSKFERQLAPQSLVDHLNATQRFNMKYKLNILKKSADLATTTLPILADLEKDLTEIEKLQKKRPPVAKGVDLAAIRKFIDKIEKTYSTLA
ncbi:MAG: hypothetical protein H0W88_10100 [Parachlamydiaceae bacterium]|nr:hypothetical protein [Parachlamydiaceae bacterium]